MATFDQLWADARAAFATERCWRRARRLALCALVALTRRTIAGLLTTSAQHDRDWSAAYRLFERPRFDPDKLQGVALQGLLEALPPDAPLVALLDDTRLRRRGRKVAGASWQRDPLGPPFQTNLVWAQRFVQISAALPEQSTGPGRARAIPIDLRHCPPPPKPPKQADAAARKAWRVQYQSHTLCAQALARLRKLRQDLDERGQRQRPLRVVVDGGYTNATVLKGLPERSTLIGRVRKDAVLFTPPPPPAPGTRGRKRCYGEPLPTPEALRQDESVPWQKVRVWAAGREHEFQIKTLGPVRWRGAGARDLRLVVVRPLGYRPRRGSTLLYRQPAYLLCSAPQLDLEQLLQAYVWRWEIEVNFRDQKTLLGVGQAQVRTARAVAAVPQLLTSAYALLLLAGRQVGAQQVLRARWNRPREGGRVSTAQLQGLLRAQLWGQALGVGNLTDFATAKARGSKSVKLENSVFSAVCLAHG